MPWGHTRSFASRLSHNELLANGANWQVEQWPYLVHDFPNSRVVVMGRANTYLWFDEANGQVPVHGRFVYRNIRDRGLNSRVFCADGR